MMNDIAISSDRKIFFLGVNTGFVTDGAPDARYVEFYANRATNQIHCAIVGNVVVPGGYLSNLSTPIITSDSIWATVARTITEHGSLPGVQLATAWEGYLGTRKFVQTVGRDVLAEARQIAADLGADGIDEVLNAFDEGARMAIDHGFRHVQLHGAHGYLLSILIDGRINPSSEEVLERLSCMARWLTTQDIETSIRISMRTGDRGFDAEGTIEFQDRIADLPFDFIDLSSGFYNIDKRLIYPSRPEVIRDRIEESRNAALRSPRRDFICSGRAMLNRPDMLPPNLHIGICRDLIANSNYLNDLSNGCQNRGKCHYFSRGAEHLSCALWERGKA